MPSPPAACSCRLILLTLIAGPFLAAAQPTSLPIPSLGAALLDRLEIIYPGKTELHTDIRGYGRNDAAAIVMALDSAANGMTRLDRRDLAYLADENNEWIPDSSRWRRNNRKALLRAFYKTPAHFFEVNSRYFKLRANPMFLFELGHDASEPSTLFQNRRGLEVRGEVDRKAFFYTNLVETQSRFPNYVNGRIGEYLAIPGAGFYRNYTDGLGAGKNAYDFNLASAYVGFQISKHIGIQLGHDRHFIGNGYRSLLLSDMSAPAFFLKISTRVWRFHYQNLFMELSPVSQVQIHDGDLLPKKYLALHYLSFKPSNRFSIGIFEATVFNRSRQFEFQYLNPVIFYRTVEGMIGSPDNVLLGCNTKYNLLNTIQLYGQFLLDEFTLKQFFSRSGWWANKYGVQAGIKYLNALGVDHLDFQAEFNSVRPYTYSHSDPYDSYTHYNQALAHPLGANFKEYIAGLRYQPLPRLYLSARWLHLQAGENEAAANWGSNPLLSYDTRVRDYDNITGQGVAADIDLLGLDASWMLYHNLFAELKFLMRRKNSADDTRDLQTQAVSFALRMNLWGNNLDF